MLGERDERTQLPRLAPYCDQKALAQLHARPHCRDPSDCAAYRPSGRGQLAQLADLAYIGGKLWLFYQQKRPALPTGESAR